MKKILCAFLLCGLVGFANAESLPTVDMGGSYNDVMDSEVRMDAVIPALRAFPLLHGPNGYFLGFFGNEKVFGKLSAEIEISDDFILNKDLIAKDLRNKLQQNGGHLTLGILYNACIPTAYSVSYLVRHGHSPDYLKEKYPDASSAYIEKLVKSFKNEYKSRESQHLGAEETCYMLIRMVVLKHNELVSQSSKKQEVAPQPVEPQKTEPQKKKLFGLII